MAAPATVRETLPEEAVIELANARLVPELVSVTDIPAALNAEAPSIVTVAPELLSVMAGVPVKELESKVIALVLTANVAEPPRVKEVVLPVSSTVVVPVVLAIRVVASVLALKVPALPARVTEPVLAVLST